MQVVATPERAVNEAMAEGGIPTTLPFVHREAVKALKVAYPSQEAGAAEIARALGGFYRAQQPQAATSRGRRSTAPCSRFRTSIVETCFRT